MVCLFGLGGVPSAAQTAASKSFYQLSATASPTYLQVTRDSYLLNPIVEGNLLQAQATIESSGLRNGVASLANPGAIGDFPALLPFAAPQLPVIPYPGYPLTVRSSHPGQPSNSIGLGEAPGPAATDQGAAGAETFNARTASTESGVDANAVGQALGLAAGVVKADGVRSRVTMQDGGSGAVKGVAETTIQRLTVAGMIVIDGLVSTTTVEADATRAVSKSTLEMGRATALGAGLQIDEEGVRLVNLPGVPPLPAVTLAQLTETLDTTLDQQGLDVRLVRGEEATSGTEGGSIARSAGPVLRISYPIELPPDFPVPTIPGVPVGVPLGGGVATVLSVSIGHTAGAAAAGGSVDLGALGDLGGPLGPAAGLGDEGTNLSSPGDSGGASFDGAAPSVGASGGSGAGVAAPPGAAASVQGIRSSRPGDIVPAFRWLMAVALLVVACAGGQLATKVRRVWMELSST